MVSLEVNAVLTDGLLDSSIQLLLLLGQLRVKLPHQLLQCGGVLQLQILLLLSEQQEWTGKTAASAAQVAKGNRLQ